MAKFENQLSNVLYRAFCPDPLELGEFQLGMLSAQQANKIQIHLAECQYCRAELAQLKTFLEELAKDA